MKASKEKSLLCRRCKNKEIKRRGLCYECNKIENKKNNSRRGRAVFYFESIESEEWKDIIGWEGFYQVSSFGRIKTIKKEVLRRDGTILVISEKIRKLSHQKNGYLKVQLVRNGKGISYWVHRLVAEAFIPNPENKPQVNHKKGIKNDNRVSQLEWMTYEEDRKHAEDVLGHRWDKGIRPKGYTHVQSKSVAQIDLYSGSIVKIWESISMAIKETGIKNISNCALGKARQSGGYKWEYA